MAPVLGIFRYELMWNAVGEEIAFAIMLELRSRMVIPDRAAPVDWHVRDNLYDAIIGQ